MWRCAGRTAFGLFVFTLVAVLAVVILTDRTKLHRPKQGRGTSDNPKAFFTTNVEFIL